MSKVLDSPIGFGSILCNQMDKSTMNILIIGKDPSLFQSGNDITSDTRKRHILYAARLRQKCGRGSSIRIISYTGREDAYKIERLDNDLCIYPTRSLRRALFFFDIIRLLPRVLKRWRPHLITVQTPWEEGTLGFILSWLLGVKFLPQVHFDLFSDEWKKEHWLNRWRRFVASLLIKHSDGVRVVSNDLKNKMIDLIGINECKLDVIPIGVNFTPVADPDNMELYKARIDKRLVGKPVVLFVGRFYAPKNLHLWVDVAEKIIKTISDVHFVMAGDGVLFNDIKAYIQSKGLSKKFLLLGGVGYERLPEVYAAADLFLLTSHYEGYGRVIVESFLAGVPVVSTACCGPEDIVQHKVSGYLLPKGDGEGLCKAAVHLLCNPDEARTMGLKGREYVKKELSSPALIKKLVNAWGRVVA